MLQSYHIKNWKKVEIIVTIKLAWSLLMTHTYTFCRHNKVGAFHIQNGFDWSVFQDMLTANWLLQVSVP